ncbi:hypothetical protein QVD17_09256 [Tagetes erecta]|uniref:Uncharacterized protein n=1 Tax=Tagetes erecta TaxID=13708 RepID=A0AAD8NY95_TARER|nr:hypothetical protein QVD17_09256 [Tagetes erecta]
MNDTKLWNMEHGLKLMFLVGGPAWTVLLLYKPLQEEESNSNRLLLQEEESETTDHLLVQRLTLCGAWVAVFDWCSSLYSNNSRVVKTSNNPLIQLHCIGMRGGGLGGPLLCIGDLLNDVGEEDTTTATATANDVIANSHRLSLIEPANHPSDLTKLYQESFKCLNDALDGTSHSWTAHTLELCSSLETASKLIQSSSSHVIEVSKKIKELETITNKGNLVIKEAELIHRSTSHT